MASQSLKRRYPPQLETNAPKQKRHQTNYADFNVAEIIQLMKKQLDTLSEVVKNQQEHIEDLEMKIRKLEYRDISYIS